MLKIGTQLTLEHMYTDTNEKYRCKVVEVSDQVVYVDYPMNLETKRTAFLMEGTQLRASYTEESKAAYAFQTEVLGRTKRNIPMLMLSFPGDDYLMRIQRREFVRVPTSVDVAVKFNDYTTQHIGEDISAGGMAFLIKSPVYFKDGDTVACTIALPFRNGEIKYVFTDAYIIRIREEDGIQIASAKFVDPTDEEKQWIVRFCFEKQVELRKKGLDETV